MIFWPVTRTARVSLVLAKQDDIRQVQSCRRRTFMHEWINRSLRTVRLDLEADGRFFDQEVVVMTVPDGCVRVDRLPFYNSETGCPLRCVRNADSDHDTRRTRQSAPRTRHRECE